MKNKKREIILLLIITLLGGFLRFYKLGQNPPSLYWDEVAIGLDAYSISQTGRDINDYHWLQPMFGSYGDFKAPVYIWLATIAVKLFGLNQFAIRLPAAVFGTLLIPLVYFFVKELIVGLNLLHPRGVPFDKLRATAGVSLPLVTSLIIAISPWPVQFGRIGFESHLSVFWVVLSLFLFLRGLKKSGWYFLLASLSAVLGVYSYYSVRIILPLIFFFLGIIYFKKIWAKKWSVFLSIILFFISLLPMVNSRYYEVSQNYRLGTKNLIRNFHLVKQSSIYLERHNSSLFSRLAHHRYWFVARDFIKHYFSHFSLSFLFLKGDENLRQHSGFGGEFFIIFLPFFFIGLYLMFKNIKQKPVKFLWTFLLIVPFPASVTYEVPHASRAIYLFVPLSIIIGLGLLESMRWLTASYSPPRSVRFNRTHLGGVLPAIFILAIAVNLGIYLHDYHLHYPTRSSKTWIYAYKKAAEFIKENLDKYNFIKITSVYWMPQLYVVYEMPERLDQLRGIKRAMLKDSPTAFGFPGIDVWLTEKGETNKPKVEFIYPEPDKGVPKYQILKTFYFLDNTESLYLIGQ